jgi:hypothetical protein
MPDDRPPLPPGELSCGHCGAVPEVQWQRRPTEAEMTVLLTTEEERRARILAGADQDLPAPVFGPLPTVETSTIAVFGCRDHAVHVDAAARVHGGYCSAPHPDRLPACDCNPEPHPAPAPLSVPKAPTPTGWMLPVAAL